MIFYKFFSFKILSYASLLMLFCIGISINGEGSLQSMQNQDEQSGIRYDFDSNTYKNPLAKIFNHLDRLGRVVGGKAKAAVYQTSNFFKRNRRRFLRLKDYLAFCIIFLASVCSIAYIIRMKEREEKSKLDGEITVGESKCNGRQINLPGDASIVQVKVLNQFGKNGGGNASCGYHALNNGTQIMHSLINNGENLQQLLNNPEMVNNLFGKNGEWRELIRSQRSGNLANDWANGGWLDQENIQSLINNNNWENLCLMESGMYKIIDDMSILSNQSHPEEKLQRNLRAVYNNLHSGNTLNCVYCFILGTMERKIEEGQIVEKASTGHWFTVVARKNGNNREYILADSANSSCRLYSDHVRTFIRCFEGEEAAKNLCELR